MKSLKGAVIFFFLKKLHENFRHSFFSPTSKWRCKNIEICSKQFNTKTVQLVFLPTLHIHECLAKCIWLGDQGILAATLLPILGVGPIPRLGFDRRGVTPNGGVCGGGTSTEKKLKNVDSYPKRVIKLSLRRTLVSSTKPTFDVRGNGLAHLRVLRVGSTAFRRRTHSSGPRHSERDFRRGDHAHVPFLGSVLRKAPRKLRPPGCVPLCLICVPLFFICIPLYLIC